MESIHRFPRPLSTYRVADKAQNPSAVKFLLSLVTGRKSRSSSKEDFVHPSIQPRIPNIRQTSVVSSCNDEEDDNNSGMDKRYEINAVDRTRTDARVTSVARENRGIRMSNNQVVSQCIESSFPPDEKYGNLLNKRIPASSDGTPGSPPSSSSSIRSITSTFVPRKSDKVMPEKPAISLVHNSIGISSPHSHSSKIMQQNSNCRPQLRHQQQYGNYLEGHHSNQYDQQIPTKLIVIPFSSSSAPLQGQSPMILPKIRGGDKSENRVTKGTDVLCCDKCDGRHETAICPHYKKKREGHIDAQKNGWKLVGGSSPLPGAFLRFAKIIPQPGDGSCLFHSLSYGIKDDTSASILRYDISTYIQQHPHTLICDTPLCDWVKWDSNTSCMEYSRRMRNGAWGGGIEMACTSLLKGCNVHVYESLRAGGYRRISAFDHPARPESKRIVRVLYRGGVHYDALLCVE